MPAFPSNFIFVLPFTLPLSESTDTSANMLAAALVDCSFDLVSCSAAFSASVAFAALSDVSALAVVVSAAFSSFVFSAVCSAVCYVAALSGTAASALTVFPPTKAVDKQRAKSLAITCFFFIGLILAFWKNNFYNFARKIA